VLKDKKIVIALVEGNNYSEGPVYARGESTICTTATFWGLSNSPHHLPVEN